jgi:Pex2 / Pex12 amino terminal region
VFAQRYPRYILRVVNRHEEFYAILMFFVEKHYLKKYGAYFFYSFALLLCYVCGSLLKLWVSAGASFAENFYGLKRRKRPLIETERARAAVGGILPQEKLGAREIKWSLLFLVS